MLIYINLRLGGHLSLGLNGQRGHCRPFRLAPNGHHPPVTGNHLRLLQRYLLGLSRRLLPHFYGNMATNPAIVRSKSQSNDHFIRQVKGLVKHELKSIKSLCKIDSL